MDCVAAVVLACIAYRGLLFQRGDVIMRFEWYIPSFPREISNSVAWSTHAWFPHNFGFASVYPTYIFAVWWHAVIAWLGGGAAIVDRVEVVAPFVGAFVSMGALCRSLTSSIIAARVASVVYATSPFLFYHTASGHIPYTQTYALAPLALLCSLRWARGSRINLLFLAVAFAFVPEPQPIVFLLLLVFITTLTFGGLRRAIVSAGVAAGAVSAVNSWWLLPALIFAGSTVTTLQNLQPLNVEYLLKHSIAARSLASVLLLRDYNHVVELDIVGTLKTLEPLLTLLAFGVPALALVGVVRRRWGTPATQAYALWLGVLSLPFFVLLVGPAGILATPVIYLYRHVPDLSLFKENYHFAFPLALTLPVLSAFGFTSLGRHKAPALSGVVIVLVLLGWSAPVLLSGDLAGWAQPDSVPAAWAIPERARTAPQERLMILPGTANLHPAWRITGSDGVDPNLILDGGFGTWLAMSSVGYDLLHRAHDDRLRELAALASVANIRYAYVRDSVRSTHMQDNPFTDSVVLRTAAFREDGPSSTRSINAFATEPLKQGPSDVRLQTARIKSTTLDLALGPNAKMVRLTKDGSVNISAGRTFRRQVYILTAVSEFAATQRALYLRSSQLRGRVTLYITITTAAGKAVYAVWLPAESSAFTQNFVLRNFPEHSVLKVIAFPVTVPFEVRLTLRGLRLKPAAVADGHEIAASAQRPLLITGQEALPLGCASPRYSPVPSQVAYADGAVDTVAIVPTKVQVCPAPGELLRARINPIGVSVARQSIVYDGDLTAIRAADIAGHGRGAPGPDFIRLDHYWALPKESRPRVMGFVGSAGAAKLGAMLTCRSCSLLEPGAGGGVLQSYDLAAGWVTGNAGSNWVTYYDDFDTESTYRFVVTKSALAFHWSFPCAPGLSSAMLALSANAKTTVRLQGRPIELHLSKRPPDIRQGMRWYDLGEFTCQHDAGTLQVTGMAGSITAIHALVTMPADAPSQPTAPIVTYAIVPKSVRVHQDILMPANLFRTALGNAVPPAPPVSKLELKLTGSLPDVGRQLTLDARPLNPAAYLVSTNGIDARARDQTLEFPERYDPQWVVFTVPASFNARIWWWCALSGPCKRVLWPHTELNGYANGWLLPAVLPSRLLIVFLPEILYAAIKSLLMFALGVIVLLVAARLLRTNSLRAVAKKPS
ncbi:MAG: hypothetical protein GIW99_11750 [Candidatus Eremiobacteraeota bacterium]|nr:hypothetical protein [Candidatus Eremiobacteraeota bacterium]